MSDVSEPIDPGLTRACEAWESLGDFAGLKRWLARHLTAEGCPIALPIPEWIAALDRVRLTRERRADWPRGEASRVDGWLWRLLHLTRPDGSTCFGPTGKSAGRNSTLHSLAASANDPALAGVVSGWFPARSPKKPGTSTKTPTLPSANRSESGRVLASLRSGWDKEASWLAVDGRSPSLDHQIELTGIGKPWISGAWPTPPHARASAPSCFLTSTYTDCLEWSFKAGDTRITRTAVMLWFTGVALLAQQEDGPPTPNGLELPLFGEVSATNTDAQRSLSLVSGRSKARVIPLNLPALPYETDKGSLTVKDSQIQLTSQVPGRRRWIPALITWGKPPTQWRVLTVTENMKKCEPEVAFGARLAFGPGQDGLLIYRSLGKPALRAVLGHQTRARFLIGRFTPEGKVVPLLTLD